MFFNKKHRDSLDDMLSELSHEDATEKILRFRKGLRSLINEKEEKNII